MYSEVRLRRVFNRLPDGVPDAPRLPPARSQRAPYHFPLLNAKVPAAAIAEQLGRHRSTIHREISRNDFHAQRDYAGYDALNAQDLTIERRRRQRRLCRDDGLHRYVLAGLERCWSPEQIAGRLKLAGDGACLSHETIYQFVYSPEVRALALHRHLLRARRLSAASPVARRSRCRG